MKPNDALIRATVVQEAEQSDRLKAATKSDVEQQQMAGSFPTAITQAEALAIQHGSGVTDTPVLPDADFIADPDVDRTN